MREWRRKIQRKGGWEVEVASFSSYEPLPPALFRHDTESGKWRKRWRKVR
jgi:transposase